MAELEISKLNEMLTTDPRAVVEEAERLYHNRIGNIADYIVGHGGIRILLLAGPSGSGKTTTANLIKDAVAARGEKTIVVSLDDFYRDADDQGYPRGRDGERDYESPEALQLGEIRQTLTRIAQGESFVLPKYDFKVGGRVAQNLHEPMPQGCVIIEGLHALNPKICEGIEPGKALKLFVSVSTNINRDGKRILSGRKIRFVRRLVRDSIYRAADAERTLKMWREVLKAEDIYLYPFKNDADLAFDTFHSFELGVMKPFVQRLIGMDLSEKSEYAATVSSAIDQVVYLSDELVPDNSLIREFIPGGLYENLY